MITWCSMKGTRSGQLNLRPSFSTNSSRLCPKSGSLDEAEVSGNATVWKKWTHTHKLCNAMFWEMIQVTSFTYSTCVWPFCQCATSFRPRFRARPTVWSVREAEAHSVPLAELRSDDPNGPSRWTCGGRLPIALPVDETKTKKVMCLVTKGKYGLVIRSDQRFWMLDKQ